MAGDWIPMRLDLTEDPAVMRMAELLEVREEVVVGYLHAVWSWASRHCHDGCVTNVTLTSLGRVTNLHGFPEVMRDVGWIDAHFDADETPVLTFPKWENWLANSAKKRLQDAKRQANRRKNGGQFGVTKMSRSNRDKSVTREEKRREEKNDPLKSPKGDDAFERFWSLVHQRVGKEASRRAFSKATSRLSSDRGCSKPEAAEEITKAMERFARSPASRPTDHSPIHPATWLNQGRYEDDPATWGSSNNQPEIKLLKRQS